MLRKLQVHQVELEMQNAAALQEARDDAERLSKRYSDLYFITEGKQLEEQREVTMRLLDLINSSTDFRELMRKVVQLLRAATGCQSIGIRLREGEDFPYFETSGFEESFVQAESKLCARDLRGGLLRDARGNPVLECMCGNILCSRFDATQPFFTARGSFWTNSATRLLAGISEAERQTRTRHRCHGEGYESVALIGLHTGGETFGLLQFNDRRPDRFTPERISHLEQIADHLASAVARWQAQEARQKSDDALRMAAQAAGFGHYSYDFVSGSGDWSPEFKALLGLKPHETLPLDADKVFVGLHPDDRPAFLAAMTAANDPTGNGLLELEFRILHPDGSVRWLQVRGLTTFTGEPSNRRPERAAGVVLDITERRQMEESARHFRQMLERTFASLPDALFIVDAVTAQILDCNPAACETFGYSRQEMLGRDTLFLHLDEPALADFRRHLATAVRKHGFLHLSEFSMKRKDGTLFTTEHSVVPIENEQGQRVAWVSVVRDITVRTQAEEALSASEKQLKEAEKVAHVGHYNIYLGTGKVEWSEETFRIFGLDPKPGSEPTVEAYTALLHPDDVATLHGHYERTVREHLPFDLTYRIRRTDGRIRHVHSVGLVVTASDGQGACLFGTFQDVTEQHEMEEALRMSEIRLNQTQRIAKVGGWEYDVAAERLWWTEEVYRIHEVSFEYDANDVQRALEFYVAADRPRIEMAFRRAVEHGEPFDLELQLATAQGHQVWVRTVGQTVRLQGKVDRVFGTIMDITERKQAEAALRQSEALFSTIFQFSPVAIGFSRVDDDRFADVNEAFLQMFGHTREEVIGRTSLQLGLWPSRAEREDLLGVLGSVNK